MSNKVTVNPSGFTLLQVLFIGLKLGKVINWSWLWILAPTWLPLAIFLIIVVGVILIKASGITK